MLQVRDSALPVSLECDNKPKKALVEDLMEAVDIFRLQPRPSVEDAERVKLLLHQLREELALANAETQKWKALSSMVMEQCYQQQETILSLLTESLQDSLESEESKLERVQLMAADSQYPLVVGEQGVKLIRAIFDLRKNSETERLQDAKHLKEIVLKAQALGADNESLLRGNVDMHMHITKLQEKVQGLEQALKKRKALGSAAEDDCDGLSAEEIGQAVLSLIQKKRHQSGTV